jgi:predicted ATPase
MINELYLKNFKAWGGENHIPLADLSVFFGTNSSGKTSILQSLLCLKQTAESNDRQIILRTDGLANLGTIPEIIHGGEKELGLGLTWQLPITHLLGEGLPGLSQLTFWTGIGLDDKGRPAVQSLNYESEALSLNMKATAQGEYSLALKLSGKEPKRAPNRPFKQLPRPVKCYGFPPEASRYYQNINFLPDLSFSLEQLFEQVFYLGPLRDYPQRRYDWAGERPADMGRQGELAVAALLAAGKEKITKRRGKVPTLQEKVAHWLQKMGIIHNFTLKEVSARTYELRVQLHENSKEVLITDVGFGVSQLLPVLVICYYSPPGSTIILEQPEIHLHPSAQSVLADVMIDAISSRGVQIIVESHSEHFLRRLQRRIAENEFEASKSALYFCEMQAGASHLTSSSYARSP